MANPLAACCNSGSNCGDVSGAEFACCAVQLSVAGIKPTELSRRNLRKLASKDSFPASWTPPVRQMGDDPMTMMKIGAASWTSAAIIDEFSDHDPNTMLAAHVLLDSFASGHAHVTKLAFKGCQGNTAWVGGFALKDGVVEMQLLNNGIPLGIVSHHLKPNLREVLRRGEGGELRLPQGGSMQIFNELLRILYGAAVGSRLQKGPHNGRRMPGKPRLVAESELEDIAID